VEDDQTRDESSYSITPPLVTPGGTALSDSEKAEALADSLETQFQPVTDPSAPAVIEMVDVVLRSYFMSPARDPKLTNPDVVEDVIRGLKVSKALGFNRVLKHLPQRAVSLLAQIFNSILLTHHFPAMWKHALVISTLKPGKDPALPSSYRPISLLDMIGEIFEKILLARILHEVSEHGLLRDELFGFRPRQRTSLQLARFVERITRNFGEKKLTGADFLELAKAFDTVWISPVLFSLYVNDTPSPSHHVELALYADDAAIIATSRKPTLLVSYLEAYLNDLQRWLTEWRLTINVSKNTACIFARSGRRFIQPRPLTLFGERIEWVDITRYLGVTLDTRLTWSPHIDQFRRRAAQRLGMLGPLLNRKSDLSVRNGVLL
jgi:hypothetical protein